MSMINVWTACLITSFSAAFLKAPMSVAAAALIPDEVLYEAIRHAQDLLHTPFQAKEIFPMLHELSIGGVSLLTKHSTGLMIPGSMVELKWFQSPFSACQDESQVLILLSIVSPSGQHLIALEKIATAE